MIILFIGACQGPKPVSREGLRRLWIHGQQVQHLYAQCVSSQGVAVQQ